MSAANESAQSKKQRRRKRKEENTVTADKIPGFMGDKTVDELLSIIEGSNGAAVSTNNHKKVTSKQERETHKNSNVLNSNNVLSGSLLGNVDATEGNLTSSKIAENKIKKTKKNKTASNMTSKTDADEKTHYGTGDENEKVRDTISESSFSSDLKDISNTPAISSSKASSVDEEGPFPKPLEENFHDSAIQENYIFTDFERKIQKEEQFTVVAKKKKKVIGPVVPLSRDYPVRDYTVDHSRRDEVPLRRRSRPVQRSFTPPPITTTTSGQDKTSERSLSPSAFPVLANNRERRNSTGNVSEFGANYDSDMESVKSVPVTGSASDTGKTVDISGVAGYKPPSISYASIAAGGQRNSQAESGSASTCSQDGDHPAPACSAGSNIQVASEAAAENLMDESSNPHTVNYTSDSSAESKSTEPLNTTTSRPSSAPSVRLSAKANLSQQRPSTSSNGKNNSVSPSINCSSQNDVNKDQPSASKTEASVSSVVSGANVSNESLKEIANDTINSQPIGVSNKDFPTLLSTQTHEVAPVIPPMSVIAAEALARDKSVENELSDSTALSHVDNPGNKSPAAKPPMVPNRNTNSKSKVKPGKSVIFLDRRMNEGAKNLDISFGFEPDLDNNVIYNPRLDSSSTCSSDDSGRGTDCDHIITGVNIHNDQALDNRTFNHVTENRHLEHLTNNMNMVHSIQEHIHSTNQFEFMDNDHQDYNPVTFTPEELHKFKMVAPPLPPNGIINVPPVILAQAQYASDIENNRINVTPVIHHQACIITQQQSNPASQAECHISDCLINQEANCPQQGESEPEQSTVVGQGDVEPNQDNQVAEKLTEEEQIPDSQPNQACEENTSDNIDNHKIEQKAAFMYDRESDPNFQVGNFNHEASVAFLFADWQKAKGSARWYDEVPAVVLVS